MIIESMIRERNYCSVVAYTPKHIYNAWKRVNTLHLYVLSNVNVTDVIHHFTARIENGEIRAIIDDMAMTLYSHGELENAIYHAFSDDWHNVSTILETLLYVE